MSKETKVMIAICLLVLTVGLIHASKADLGGITVVLQTNLGTIECVTNQTVVYTPANLRYQFTNCVIEGEEMFSDGFESD